MAKRKNGDRKERIKELFEHSIRSIKGRRGSKKRRKEARRYESQRRMAMQLLPIIRKRIKKTRKQCVFGNISLAHKQAWRLAGELEASLNGHH